MENENDADYYLRREAEERDLARQASDPSVSRIHAELAENYAIRARAVPPKIKMPTSL